ncbi:MULTISPECIES: Crp/Fnr family transcriptional regulator [unclassified Achromobacter]|jgi:CRP-like cAMP-binding protein|uniref:Crp/Fnr family transcriptional regulator n=1 Tax=unclassified Achromobacter TaxID=2626865 RepID=UPI00069FDAD5|nr:MULTISPECIES: Crp/Fnr family transcriptional regulator [unclassified Achromobacter]KOF53485.1 Crp/Fnr family transcriptional regulator [Achromobacter sp. DMS1]
MSDVSNIVSPAEREALFRACAWFRALAPAHQALVLGAARAERVPDGACVARRNAPADFWLGVHTGLLKLAIYNESGRSCTFSGVPPGGWFGEGSVIKRELRKYDVVAIQPSLVMQVPAHTFHELLASSLPFSRFVIDQLNNRMGEFIASIQNHRLLDPDARVAQSLAQLFNPNLYPSTDLALPISQEELGYLTGLSRQRVNQALQSLADQGMLALAYNQIRVLDLERLRRHGLDQL